MSSFRHDTGSAGPDPTTRRTLTILLVEDDDTVRGLLRTVLERHGCIVLEASDGQAGLELARTRGLCFDLLITDVVMPELNGREMVDLMRAQWPSLPVLFMTGNADPSTTGFGDLGNGESLLLKPFRPSELIARVQELIGT